MTTLNQILAAAHIEGNTLHTELTPDWLQGRTAYGGWQAAVAVSAMQRVLGDVIALRSLQATFIAPVPPGPVKAQATILRRGKSATQIEARILVGDQVGFIAVGIFGSDRASAIRHLPAAPADVRPVDSLENSPFIEGVKPEFTRRFDTRWGAGSQPFTGADHSDAQIFVRLQNDAVTSDAHLVGLADAIPPSAISLMRTPAPISSMNWALEIVAQPDEAERRDWFRFDCGLTAGANGYGWENTSIWSAQGRLIALSRQCVALFG
jgi:acyl-CoA thioesterase